MYLRKMAGITIVRDNFDWAASVRRRVVTGKNKQRLILTPSYKAVRTGDNEVIVIYMYLHRSRQLHNTAAIWTVITHWYVATIEKKTFNEITMQITREGNETNKKRKTLTDKSGIEPLVGHVLL